MCRSIKRLREGREIAGEEEVRAAATQFVRKISGFNRPSSRHVAAFDQAVEEVTRAAEALLLSVAEEMDAAHRRPAGLAS